MTVIGTPMRQSRMPLRMNVSPLQMYRPLLERR
jgi:hypothetical protein